MALDLQKTIDARTEGNVGGMSTIPANQSTLDVQKAVDTTTPVQEVGMISSQQGLQEVKKADETLQTLEGVPEEKQAALDKIDAEVKTETTQPEKVETPTSTFVNEETGQEITKTGELTKDEQDKLASQGYTLTESTDTSSPELDKLKSEVKTAETEYNNAYKKLAESAIGSDELRGIVRSIKSSYGGRIARMERTNERRYKTLKTIGIRLGSRYSGGSGGVFGSILSEEERQGMARIDELEAEMESAINDAKMKAKEYNLTAYTELIKEAENKREEKIKAFEELKKATEEADELAKEEETKLEQQANVIEQVNSGVTSPFEIFKQLNGEVPFDVIKEMTKELPDAEDVKLEFKTGDKYQPAGYFNPKTGEFTYLSGSGTSQSIGNGLSTGAPSSSMILGAPTIEGLGTTYDNSTGDAKLTIDQIFNKLPTQLKNNVAEHELHKENIRRHLAAGYSPQQIVDILEGFVLFEGADKQFGMTLYNYAQGTALEPGDLASLVNRGANEQAMTTVENAQLENADGFFAGTDKARSTVKQSDIVLKLLEKVPIDKLGAFDGRKFQVGRFAGLTDAEMVATQQLESALQTLNAPIRVEIVGTAATEAEMSKITGFQADILDQPAIIKAKVSELRDSVLRFHNEARSQRGLPQVDTTQLIDNKARLALYKDITNINNQAVKASTSNTDFLGSGAWQGTQSLESESSNSSFFSEL